MKLVTAQIVPLSKNEYVFNISGTGTSSFEFSVEDGEFTVIDNSAVSGVGNGKITLPECDFRATLTGDAEAWIVPTA